VVKNRSANAFMSGVRAGVRKTRVPTPAALVVLDLRAATSCEGKREVLSRAEEHGDARALKLLKPMAARSGCGFLGINDCFPCLRQDKVLADAIAAIEARKQ
jgi:hypothetical protein